MAANVQMIQKRKPSGFERAFALAGATAALCALGIVQQINPSGSNLFPVCPLHAMTGLNCPGCGATRGMHALLNGDVFAALHYNMMLIVFVPLMIYGIIALIMLGLRGRGLTAPRFAPQGIWVFLVLMLAFGILRNLPFYPFSLFAI